MMYCEVALGNVASRGLVVDASLLIDYASKATDEMYNSYYRFDEEIIEHFKIRKTIRNYRGKYYLTNPIVDIDKGTNSDSGVLDRARFFIERIWKDYSIPAESLDIYFSGRGYHIVLPDIFNFQPSNQLPLQVKAVMDKMFPEGDNIYDGARLIRTPNTLNMKSGLYKTQILLEDLFSKTWVEIQGKAQKRPEHPPVNIICDPDEMPDITKHMVIPKVEVAVAGDDVNEIATCVQLMYNEGPIEGSRHEKLLRMAASWRRGGIPKKAIYNMFTTWATNMEPYEIKRIVDDVFSKGYSPYGCNDPLMAKYCSDKCLFYRKKNYLTEVVEANTAEEEFAKFITSGIEEKAFDLKDIYGCKTFKFYPGEAVAIIGDTKLGKSTFVQNLAIELRDYKVLYLPLENHQHLAYRRFIQIAHKMTKEEVSDYYKDKGNSYNLSDEISHIKMVVLPPTINDLSKIITQHKPQITIIDTMDGIDTGNIRDEVQKTSYLAREFKNLAMRNETIIMGVGHISKSAASQIEARGLNKHSAKGSSDLEQKFDKLLAWEGKEDSRQRWLTSLAARDEQGIRIAFEVFFENFTIHPIGVRKRL